MERAPRDGLGPCKFPKVAPHRITTWLLRKVLQGGKPKPHPRQIVTLLRPPGTKSALGDPGPDPPRPRNRCVTLNQCLHLPEPAILVYMKETQTHRRRTDERLRLYLSLRTPVPRPQRSEDLHQLRLHVPAHFHPERALWWEPVAELVVFRVPDHNLQGRGDPVYRSPGDCGVIPDSYPRCVTSSPTQPRIKEKGCS